jgi:hypothetical protein
MAEGRPDIPAQLKRDVLVEAGHRCAIPTCRSVPVELAHITPWAKVKDHTFDNLIALCPTCHARYDRGEIDRKAMQQYKSNLGLLTNRYSPMEMRMLEGFAAAFEQGHPTGSALVTPNGMAIMYWYLLKDGIVEGVAPPAPNIMLGDIPMQEAYRLTPKGLDLVQKWFAAEDIDDV